VPVLLGLLAALVLVLAAAGCSDDTAPDVGGPGLPSAGTTPASDPVGGPEAQPRPGSEGFGQGDFDGIPLIPGSEQIGPTSTQQGVTAATFTVQGLTARQAVDDMAALLGDLGATPLVAPVERPPGAFRSEWAFEGRRIEVVATSLEGDDGSSQFDESSIRMQYSVLIHADLDDADVDADEPSTDLDAGTETTAGG
jgi:hypothetical protein